MVQKWRGIDVDATSPRRIDVNTTSFLRHVPARKSVNQILVEATNAKVQTQIRRPQNAVCWEEFLRKIQYKW